MCQSIISNKNHLAVKIADEEVIIRLLVKWQIVTAY